VVAPLPKLTFGGVATTEKGGEMLMLHISGRENIVLPHVNQMIVSNITPLGTPDAEQPYQRELVFVTDEGTLSITLIANNRDTLALVGE
jgi:hypothetical protein